MQVNIADDWKEILFSEFEKEYFKSLICKIKIEYSQNQIYPVGKNIFRAFDECRYSDLKVVILGQDPYHTDGVANGLAFASNIYNYVPPSLKNIFKEIKDEFGTESKASQGLIEWANQGILLLNSSLTVRKGEAGSHKDIGWTEFTDSTIKIISETRENIVFILWGNYARSKKKYIDMEKHLVLESAHPSPFSAYSGFFGNSHFKLCNEYLDSRGITQINW